MNRLRSLGLTQPLLAQLTLDELESHSVGRVLFESHGHCTVATEDGELPARLHPRLRAEGHPDGDGATVVGDWVALDRTGDPAWIVRRLERFRDRLGVRFSPAPVLVELAKTGRTFHGEGAIAPGTFPRKKKQG